MAESAIHGLGLFAAETIAGGSYIGFYAGEETSENGMHVLWVQQDDDSWLGFDGNNKLRFINHARPPNCEMDGQDLYAAREIMKDEELTIDYGEDFDPVAGSG